MCPLFVRTRFCSIEGIRSAPFFRFSPSTRNARRSIYRVARLRALPRRKDALANTSGHGQRAEDAGGKRNPAIAPANDIPGGGLFVRDCQRRPSERLSR